MSFEIVAFISLLLFGIGLLGVVTRRNLLGILLASELMFNALVLLSVAVVRFIPEINLRLGTEITAHTLNLTSTGYVLAIFIISIAAAETALAVALLLAYNAKKGKLNITKANELKG